MVFFAATEKSTTDVLVDGRHLRLINQILEPDSKGSVGDGHDDSSSEAPNPSKLSLQQQIIHEPQRGDLWLDLAKEVAGKAAEGSESNYYSALVAARRATTILSAQLLSLKRQTGDRAGEHSARDLSDALALLYWLENCKNESGQEESKLSPKIELQRSLLLCPDNRIAREAVEQTTNWTNKVQHHNE